MKNRRRKGRRETLSLKASVLSSHLSCSEWLLEMPFVVRDKTQETRVLRRRVSWQGTDHFLKRKEINTITIRHWSIHQWWIALWWLSMTLADQGPSTFNKTKEEDKVLLLLFFKILLGPWHFSPVLVYSEKFLSFDLDFLTWFYYAINLCLARARVYVRPKQLAR